MFRYISALAASALFMLAAITTGAYAWLDFGQHKSNYMSGNLSGGSYGFEVFLVESFDPPSTWAEGETVDKRIFVRNGATEPVYVRLALKEYLEYAEYTYSLSEYRYLTDASGAFITFASASAADAAY
jgi:hypothetical protein